MAALDMTSTSESVAGRGIENQSGRGEVAASFSGLIVSSEAGQDGDKPDLDHSYLCPAGVMRKDTAPFRAEE